MQLYYIWLAYICHSVLFTTALTLYYDSLRLPRQLSTDPDILLSEDDTYSGHPTRLSMEAILRPQRMGKADLLLVTAAVLVSHFGGATGAAATSAAAERREEKNDAWMYIQIHSWLMWVSMGFLFPLGAVLVRFNRSFVSNSNSAVSPARTRLLLYLHTSVQCGGVAAATAGIATLLKRFGATLDHTHMRLGLALWIIVMAMPVISTVRPARGTQLRRYWLFVHWLFGTGVLVLGIVNCYIGIGIYERFHGSIRSLNIAFSVQVAAMALVYFLQDRFSYILGQGSNEISQVPGKVAHHQDLFKRDTLPAATV